MNYKTGLQLMTTQANPHHLVLGELKDFLTGSIIPDTLDERYRQKIAEILVVKCGFKKEEISSNSVINVTAGEKRAKVKVDFLIRLNNRIVMLIKYSPGSLVTRQLSTVGLSRIIEPYQIPVAVITNGEDAHIIDGSSGKVTAEGLDNLPIKSTIENNFSDYTFPVIKQGLFEQASRIVYACEIDDACPCDSDNCVITT